MGFLSAKTLAGPGYIILNILRAFNVITLLAIAAAGFVLLVKIHIDSNVSLHVTQSMPLSVLITVVLLL